MNHLDSLKSIYMDQPNEISLETQAVCNAACTFCPYPTLERKGEKMSDDMIDRLVGEMAEFKRPFAFSPFKLSDPLLDKRVIPLCARMNREVPHAYIRLFTNGSALTVDKIQQIATLKNVLHLWVSLNSHIPEEYERLMGLPFERTASRLDVLHGIEFPHEVMLSCVGFPNEPFRRYCFERWPKFKSFALKKDGWLGFTEAQELTVPDTPCSRWFELSITATGVVALCCMDSEGKFPIGDLNKQTMLEVYNAPQWRDRREKMLSRREVHPCSTCSY